MTLFRDLLRRYIGHLSGALTYLPALQHDWGKLTPWGRFQATLRSLHALILQEIDERRSGRVGSQSDVLSLLLDARDDDGRPLGDEDVRDELLTLLAAGHETTASALAWSFEHLLRSPAVLGRLIAELDEKGDLDHPASFGKLPFLEAVCQETLRLYPVISAVSRKVAAEVEINGRRYPPGVCLSPCIYLTHRREDIYPQAGRFSPERFLEQSYSPYESLPFGGGVRRCIGAAYAMQEMEVVLGTLFSTLRFSLDPPAPLRSQRNNVTVSPRGGTWVRIDRAIGVYNGK